MTPIISAQQLSFTYGATSVLHNLNFDIQEGEYVGVIGPNGSGKTTLMKLVLGLLEPTSGTLKIFGNESSERSHRTMIGYVPQHITSSYAFFPATVEEIVKGGRASHVGFFDFSRKHDESAVHEALEEVDMLQYKKRLIYELSGGQLQRVFIARALARRPKMLIFDEPTTGVDIQSQKQFYELLAKLNKKGITIMLVSHDVDVVAGQVGMVLCLNRELVCHVKTDAFITEDYLKKLYGKDMKYVMHH